MSIPDYEALRGKLDALGPAEVRKRLQIGAFAKSKLPIVEAWLAEHPAPIPQPVEVKSQTHYDRYVARLKNHPLIAILIITSAVIVGLAQFSESITKLGVAIGALSEKTVTLPPIPGDTGWIFLGYINRESKKYEGRTLYRIEHSTYSDQSEVPRNGELLHLLAERRVVIPSFKTSGLQQRFVPPWQLNILSESDYTGVTLPLNSIVEVRDVGLGSFPGKSIAVWVRIAPPSK
jgi:hypothetical protein